jgi:hypothetical protein
MKIAFLTEMGFTGKIHSSHTNMRTEFAWMNALDADHYNIRYTDAVKQYDHVFVIFPKGMVYLNAIAIKMSQESNPVSDLLESDFIYKLKMNNSKVHFVQEGPHWLWNDYEIRDQILYINMIQSCDSIFCHNESDTYYYKGLFPNKKVSIIPSLMVENLIENIIPTKEDKVIIGGNFARWYGGFESYSIATTFDLPIWVQDSHAKRNQEPMMENLTHFPRMEWSAWMQNLSTFKYAVHMMPTVAAGTFALNCAYFGIPCIGNANVDTQILCHTALSVDVNDLSGARQLAMKLKEDKEFYEYCSKSAIDNYKKYYNIQSWKENMSKIIN